MTQAIARTEQGSIIEAVIAQGDLSKLKPEQRVAYYTEVCRSVGLNPLTKPFEYITLNGKLTLYARKDATDQLRDIRKVSVVIASREQIGDVYAVTARATTVDGRSDESIGAVSIASLKGDSLANALMKAETKAKRRVTLSICGLGLLDETEIETIPNARPVAEPSAPLSIAPPPSDQPIEAETIVEQDRSPESITKDQMENLVFLLDTLAGYNVSDEQLLAGINNLAGANLTDLEIESLATLSNPAAAKVISAYNRKLDKFAVEAK